MGASRRPVGRLSRAQVRDLHTSLLEIVSMINAPQRDDALLGKAGLSLERALLPLLVGVDRFGPIAVGDLAARAGRDYTTVSRQLARLESAGLVRREPDGSDRRVHKVSIAARGSRMMQRVDRAREQIARNFFRPWSRRDTQELLRLMKKFSDQARLPRPRLQ